MLKASIYIYKLKDPQLGFFTTIFIPQVPSTLYKKNEIVTIFSTGFFGFNEKKGFDGFRYVLVTQTPRSDAWGETLQRKPCMTLRNFRVESPVGCFKTFTKGPKKKRRESASVCWDAEPLPKHSESGQWRASLWCKMLQVKSPCLWLPEKPAAAIGFQNKPLSSPV